MLNLKLNIELSLVLLHTGASDCRCVEVAKCELNYLSKFIKGACVFLMRLKLFGSALKVTLIEFAKKFKSGQAFAATCLLVTFRLRKSNEEKYGIKAMWNGSTPTTNIENNYKTFYTLQRAYLQNQDLTLLENIQLLLLAYQCPFTDGQVVYNARALYNLVNQTIVVYNDFNCASRGFSFGRTQDSVENYSPEESELLNQLVTNEKETKTKFKLQNCYIIYPNPTVNEVNILSNNAIEMLQVNVLDVNGRILLSKNSQLQDYKTQLKLNLVEGVYFINITNSNGEKTTNKLVIVK